MIPSLDKNKAEYFTMEVVCEEIYIGMNEVDK